MTAQNRPAEPRVSWTDRLFQSVDIAFLVYFRIIFAVSMLYWLFKGWYNGLHYEHYVLPRLHFSYYGFEWLQPLFGNGMHLLLGFMVLAAIGMLLGYCYRVASLVMAIGFSYLFLLDKSTYQNHYYLMFLMVWIMALLPAERAFSIDAWQQPRLRSSTVPVWVLWLLRFQIGVPYFYGGLAKFGVDWFAGEPMRSALAAQAELTPLLAGFFRSEFGVFCFVWGGMLFDLLVVFFLLYKPTRVFAYIACVIFHLINSFMWPIGVFPWMMILATVVFFEPDWPRRVFRLPKLEIPAVQPGAATGIARAFVVVLLLFYVSMQSLIPFRHLLNDDVNIWTEEAHCFCWHMMLRSKPCGIRLYATDPRTGRTGTVDLRRYVTSFQSHRFGRDPRMIHELAQFVARDLEQQGFEGIEVRAWALASLNGRKPQMMIDPDVDLARAEVGWSRPSFVLPLKEPLPEVAWNVPLEEWEKYVELPERFRAPPRQPASVAPPQGDQLSSAPVDD